MEFRVLGPVEAREEERAVALGGPRPRTIIGVLALHVGTPVTADRLVDEVWGVQPPPSAVDTLQSYLSRLRAALGADRLVREAGGYALRADPAEVDAAAFVSAVEEARRSAEGGSLRAALDQYRSGLGLWRGPVADGLEPGPLIRAAAARLEDLRLVATEERIDAELSLGHHHDLPGEIEPLLAVHPHRERLYGQLMLALYRSGRQAEALAVYRTARATLVDGLGIEPGRELRLLHARILDQDPSLASPWAPPQRPQPIGDASRTPEGRSQGTGNLPALLDDFIGRLGERAAVDKLLGAVRLVTLTGAGGCGKTQLALRVAADQSPRMAGGAWLVELAPHRDARMVERAVSDALGVPESGRLREAIAARIGEQPLLLVLDNCEHLVDGAAELVAELLRTCPRLRVLATSREPLDVPGERAWRVPSLTLPPERADADALLASDAGRLFAVRAAVVQPDWEVTEAEAPTIARICRELDGIPLALELAAARLSVLSCAEIADRLGERFELLAGGRRTAPARHRTLQAAIDWSYDLLEPAQRLLLARLSVFAGGFTLDAVEGVCAGDGIAGRQVLGGVAALADKSLAQRVRTRAGPARHDLLESVRSYAAGHLSTDERRRLEARHTDFFAGLAERASPALTGPEQVAWLNRLHVEHDNLRAVLARRSPEAARVAAAIWWFWLQFGHVGEGDRWLAGILDEEGPADPQLRQRLRFGAGRLARARGDRERAGTHLHESLQLASDLGDEVAMARSWAELGLLAADDEPELARARVQRGLRLAADADGWVQAALEEAAGIVAWRGGRLDSAAAAFGSSERAYREAGDEWSACLARLGAAQVARQQGALDIAVRLHRENLVRSLDLTVSTLDFIGLPQDLQGLAAAMGRQGDLEQAVVLLGAAAALRTAVELPLQPFEGAEQAGVLERARAALGADAVVAGYRRGRSLSVEEAVQEALARCASG